MENSESVGSYNLYSYCENNPVNMADYNGNDAIYVVLYDSGTGLPILGHALLFYQAADGNWYKTEFADSKIKIPLINFPLFATLYNTKIGSKENVLTKIAGYKKADVQYLFGDYSKVEDYYNNYYWMYNYQYHFLFNNCLHYVRNAIAYAENGWIIDFNIDTCVPRHYNVGARKYNIYYSPRATGAGDFMEFCYTDSFILRYRLW